MKKTTLEKAVIVKPNESPDFVKAADDVLASEIRYRRLFESARDGILILDAVTRKIIDVNPFMINLLGYSREEFVGKELWELGLLKDEVASKTAFTELQESGYIRYGDLRLETALGQRCEVEFISTVYDEGDRHVIQCNIRDITGRMAAEDKLESLADDLEAAAEDYHRVLDNSLDVICQIDKAGQFIKISPAAKRVWGFEPEELIGTMYWDMVHPDDQIKTRHAAGNTLDGKPTSTFENRTIRKDGGVAYMMWSGNWSESHQIMYCVARDVSEIKVAETALEESTTNYRALIESLPAIVCLSQPFLPYASIYISPNAEAFGYSVVEWAGRPDMWISLIHEEDRARVLREAAEAMESGTETELEYRMVTHDGQIHWMRDKGLLTTDPEGIVNGWQRVITDVTKLTLAESKSRREQRDIEARLRTSEERLQAIFRTGPECIKLLGKKCELLDINPPGLSMIGADSLEQVRGKIFLDIIMPEYQKAFSELNRRVFGGGSGMLQFEIIGLKGVKRWLETNATALLNDRGEVEAHLGLTRDVTEKRRAQENLRENESLLSTTQRIAHVGSWVMDLPESGAVEMAKESWSDEHYRIFGFEPGGVEITNEVFYNSVHPDDRERLADTIRESIENNTPFDIEHRIVLPDGRERTVHAMSELVLDDKTGNPLKMYGSVQDITERKRIETQLIESEAHKGAILESALDCIIAIDSQGLVTEFNPAAETVFGYSRTDVIGKELAELIIPPALRDQHHRGMRHYQATGEGPMIGKRIEISAMRSDGSEFPVEVSINAVELGGSTVFTAFLRDISERNLVEDKLMSSEERYRDLVENAHDIIFTLDLSGTFTSVNKACEQITGYSFEENQGLKFQEIVAPEYLDKVKEMIVKKLGGEPVTAYETEIVAKDGHRVAIEVNSRLMFKDGIPVGVQGIARDITQRKLDSQALKKANERAILDYERLLERVASLALVLGNARELKTIFEALREFASVSAPMTGIFVSLFDRERGLRTAAYAWSDGEEIDISELPPLEMVDSPNSRAVAENRVIMTDDFQSTMKGQPSINVGLDLDPRLPQSSLAVPMSVMGRVVGAIEIQSPELRAFRVEHATAMQMAANLAANAIENVRLMDAENLQAEQLRQSQKLESVGLLAGGIAHDFNNMLTAINGYSDLTLRRMKADDPLRANIEEIKKAGGRSAALTNQLLAFSRQQILQPELVRINDVIIETSSMLERLIGEDIELVTVFKPNIGNVKADPGQLVQIVMNLAVNARDAMPTGGTLTLETSNVFVDREYAHLHVGVLPGAYVVLSVSDTGTGMTSEMQEQIFEPFFTTKDIGKGTGLGLATVYGIVKQSGGAIFVYSEIEHGTTFKIFLPRVDDGGESHPAIADMQPKLALGNETILLVEDEELVRVLSRKILESCGYNVVEARDGIEAIEVFAKLEGKIDILVTDVVMPRMGGRELVEELLAKKPGLPVLFTSGYPDDAVVRHGILDGKANFIQKPFSIDKVALKVRDLLDFK